MVRDLTRIQELLCARYGFNTLQVFASSLQWQTAGGEEVGSGNTDFIKGGLCIRGHLRIRDLSPGLGKRYSWAVNAAQDAQRRLRLSSPLKFRFHSQVSTTSCLLGWVHTPPSRGAEVVSIRRATGLTVSTMENSNVFGDNRMDEVVYGGLYLTRNVFTGL